MKRKLLVIAALSAMAAPQIGIASDDTTALKAKLQASMQREVDRRLIEGALVNIDLQTGDATRLYPVEAHPMILSMGDDGNHFVLCSDLKNSAGQSTTVDYYMARNGNRFSIVRTEINNRAPLKALMSQGKVAHLE